MRVRVLLGGFIVCCWCLFFIHIIMSDVMGPRDMLQLDLGSQKQTYIDMEKDVVSDSDTIYTNDVYVHHLLILVPSSLMDMSS